MKQMVLSDATAIATGIPAALMGMAVMLLSDATVTAFSVGIPATLAGLAAFIVALRTAKKADTIIEKTHEIHVMTNSNLTKVTNQLEIMTAKFETSTKMQADSDTKIAKLESTIASLIEKQGTSTPSAPAEPMPVVDTGTSVKLDKLIEHIDQQASTPLPVADKEVATKLDKLIDKK